MLGSFVSRTSGVAMCAKSAIAMRSSLHASDSPSTRRKRMDRCHRSSLPPGAPTPRLATSGVRIDAEPSCRITRSTPAVRTSETAAVGRASARIVSAVASRAQSQKTRPPKMGNRSRTGSRRCWRNRRASRRRRASCHAHTSSSAAGTISSQRYPGSAKRTVSRSILGNSLTQRSAVSLCGPSRHPSQLRDSPSVLRPASESRS